MSLEPDFHLLRIDLFDLGKHDLHLEAICREIVGLQWIRFCIDGLQVWTVIFQFTLEILKRFKLVATRLR